jgi:hypothetical protein
MSNGRREKKANTVPKFWPNRTARGRKYRSSILEILNLRYLIDI